MLSTNKLIFIRAVRRCGLIRKIRVPLLMSYLLNNPDLFQNFFWFDK
jgi:hypothetical protein